jgi:hypothetical protein
MSNTIVIRSTLLWFLALAVLLLVISLFSREQFQQPAGNRQVKARCCVKNGVEGRQNMASRPCPGGWDSTKVVCSSKASDYEFCEFADNLKVLGTDCEKLKEPPTEVYPMKPEEEEEVDEGELGEEEEEEVDEGELGEEVLEEEVELEEEEEEDEYMGPAADGLTSYPIQQFDLACNSFSGHTESALGNYPDLINMDRSLYNPQLAEHTDIELQLVTDPTKTNASQITFVVKCKNAQCRAANTNVGSFNDILKTNSTPKTFTGYVYFIVNPKTGGPCSENYRIEPNVPDTNSGKINLKKGETPSYNFLFKLKSPNSTAYKINDRSTKYGNYNGFKDSQIAFGNTYNDDITLKLDAVLQYTEGDELTIFKNKASAYLNTESDIRMCFVHPQSKSIPYAFMSNNGTYKHAWCPVQTVEVPDTWLV